MAISKKGSSVICVDGVKYRWRVKHRSYLELAIWCIEPIGQHLGGSFDEDRVITPLVVEYVIRTSISNGWQPEKPRMPCFVFDGDELVAGTEFELSHPPNADIQW